MTSLYMASLPINLRKLFRWAAEHGLAEDEGMAFHHLLSETFGKAALQPFRLMVVSGAKRPISMRTRTSLRQNCR